jgi:hypothetical protein
MMTFRQIGDELGVPTSTAYYAYLTGMAKLRARFPNALAFMHILADDIDSNRERRKRGLPCQ